MTHNKKSIPLINLPSKCVSAPQIMSLKDEYTFSFFFNFFIIGLVNFSANCYVAKSKRRWFCLIADLKPLSLADLSTSEADVVSKNV